MGTNLAFCSVRKIRGDESRVYVMHTAILLGYELKQLNKKKWQKCIYLLAMRRSHDLYVPTNKQAIYHCTQNHVYNFHSVSTNVLLGKYCYCVHLSKIYIFNKAGIVATALIHSDRRRDGRTDIQKEGSDQFYMRHYPLSEITRMRLKSSAT